MRWPGQIQVATRTRCFWEVTPNPQEELLAMLWVRGSYPRPSSSKMDILDNAFRDSDLDSLGSDHWLYAATTTGLVLCIATGVFKLARSVKLAPNLDALLRGASWEERETGPELTSGVWEKLKPVIPPHPLITAKSQAWVLDIVRDSLLEFTKINSVHSSAQSRALLETDFGDVIV